MAFVFLGLNYFIQNDCFLMLLLIEYEVTLLTSFGLKSILSDSRKLIPTCFLVHLLGVLVSFLLL